MNPKFFLIETTKMIHDEWNQLVLGTSWLPWFLPDAVRLCVSRDNWPTRGIYNEWFRINNVCNAAQQTLQTTESPKRPNRLRRKKLPKNTYEILLFEQALLPTRERNWHDFYNVHIWMRFPTLKAAINARQYHAPLESHDPAVKSGLARSVEQDQLTLFDEGGLVIWSDEFQHKPQDLSEQEFVSLARSGRVFLVGHALLEALQRDQTYVRALGVVLAPPMIEGGGDPSSPLESYMTHLIANKFFAEKIHAKGIPLAWIKSC